MIEIELDMNSDPVSQGWTIWQFQGSRSISNGILTINSSTSYEIALPGPSGNAWSDNVNNELGWVIETRFKLDSVIRTNPLDESLALSGMIQ